MNKVCIVVPVCNEEKNVGMLAASIATHLKTGYVILFVDDGSTDGTLREIQTLAQEHDFIQCLSLSKNFGHQNALMAGLQHASADYFIMMDGDGQHPAGLLPQMVLLLDSGIDIVNTQRIKTEGSGIIKNVFSRLFYAFINKISETEIKPNQADFRAFNKKVRDSILLFEESELFLRGIFSLVGFKTTILAFNAPPRLHGETKYSFIKMLRFALKATTSFSYKPLRLALIIGSFISLGAFLFAIYAFVEYFKGNTVSGWPSLIVAVMFLGGTQLLAIGLLGEYIAGIFTESKKRPRYIVDKYINFPGPV